VNGFAVEPVFTAWQWVGFALLLTPTLVLQYVFSPRRRALLGAPRFLLATALQAAPAAAGVSLVRGACRAGYLAEGRGFLEANLRSLVWMSGSILLGGLIVRWLPPFSVLQRDLRDAGRQVWSQRLNRWTGRSA
jgi:hypothetical protein